MKAFITVAVIIAVIGSVLLVPKCSLENRINEQISIVTQR